MRRDERADRCPSGPTSRTGPPCAPAGTAASAAAGAPGRGGTTTSSARRWRPRNTIDAALVAPSPVTRTTLPAVAVARPRQPVRHVTASTTDRPPPPAARVGGDTGGAAADGEAGTALPWGVAACAPAGGGSRTTPDVSATRERAQRRRNGRGRAAARGQPGRPRRTSVRMRAGTGPRVGCRPTG